MRNGYSKKSGWRGPLVGFGGLAVFLFGGLTSTAAALGESPDALRTFYFGNSLTGCTNPPWHEALGASADRQWTAAASLGAGWQLWQHRHELKQSGVPLDRGARDDLTIEPEQIEDANFRARRFLTESWDAIVLQPFSLELTYTTERMWGVEFDQPMDVGDIASAIDIINTFLALNDQGTVYIYQNWPAMDQGRVPPDEQLPDWAIRMKQRRGSVRRAEFPDRAAFDYARVWAEAEYKPTPDPQRFWKHENARSRDYHRKLFEALRGRFPDLWRAGRLRAIPTGDVFLAVDRAARAGEVPGVETVKDFYTDVQHIRAGLPRYTAAATFYACLFRDHPGSLDWSIYNEPAKYGDDPHHDEGELLPITEANAAAVNDLIWRVITEHPHTAPAGD